ncbi:MAG TPA: TMEM175 family protein [Methanoregulaceae archaeon]|nr:TMEM175 family protein [Methanoregulaceae archaeon]
MIFEDTTTRTIGFEKNRLETLTDGIFAFSMTLLVTGLNIPQSLEEFTTEHVYSLLVNLSPAFTHFLIAFFIIAWFWTIHHVQFHKILAVDRVLLWLNMVSMAAIVLFPFSTSLVADFPTHPLAETIFEVNLLLAGILFYCQYYYASGNRLIDPAKHHIDDFIEQAETLVIPVLSIAAIALTLARVPWTSLLYCLAPPILLVLHYRHAKKLQGILKKKSRRYLDS